MYEGIDTLVIYNELALDDSLPFTWRSSEGQRPAASPLGADTNLRVLQACLALDDQTNIDSPDEATPQSIEFARLDSKLNLMIEMLGRLLVQNQSRPLPAMLRFNARGGEWTDVTAQIERGAYGILEVYLRDCLSDPLRLAGCVESVTSAARVSVRFDTQPDAVADLLSKFIFRQHRRRVADSRNPKRA